MQKPEASVKHQNGTDQPNEEDHAQVCYTNDHQDGKRVSPMAYSTLQEGCQSALPYSTMYST